MKKTTWQQQTVTKDKNKYISLTQYYMGSGNSSDHSLRHGYQTQFLKYQEKRLLVNKYSSDILLPSSYFILILGKHLHTLNLFLLELVVNESKWLSCLVIWILEKAHGWGAGEPFLTKAMVSVAPSALSMALLISPVSAGSHTSSMSTHKGNVEVLLL